VAKRRTCEYADPYLVEPRQPYREWLPRNAPARMIAMDDMAEFSRVSGPRHSLIAKAEHESTTR
jgi:hypothetical protein